MEIKSAEGSATRHKLSPVSLSHAKGAVQPHVPYFSDFPCPQFSSIFPTLEDGSGGNGQGVLRRFPHIAGMTKL